MVSSGMRIYRERIRMGKVFRGRIGECTALPGLTVDMGYGFRAGGRRSSYPQAAGQAHSFPSPKTPADLPCDWNVSARPTIRGSDA